MNEPGQQFYEMEEVVQASRMEWYVVSVVTPYLQFITLKGLSNHNPDY